MMFAKFYCDLCYREIGSTAELSMIGPEPHLHLHAKCLAEHNIENKESFKTAKNKIKEFTCTECGLYAGPHALICASCFEARQGSS